MKEKNIINLILNYYTIQNLSEEASTVPMSIACLVLHIKNVGAFSGRIGLPPAVTGWAASYDGGP